MANVGKPPSHSPKATHKPTAFSDSMEQKPGIISANEVGRPNDITVNLVSFARGIKLHPSVTISLNLRAIASGASTGCKPWKLCMASQWRGALDKGKWVSSPIVSPVNVPMHTLSSERLSSLSENLEAP